MKNIDYWKIFGMFVFVAIIAIFALKAVVIVRYEQYQEMVFTYEQELRVQHEYLKACDAVRIYQENLLEKNGIESAVK